MKRSFISSIIIIFSMSIFTSCQNAEKFKNEGDSKYETNDYQGAI
jgi:hypothetical protein